jgi:hypothetical protein
MRNVSVKGEQEIKTHILRWITFFYSCLLWYNVSKYGKAEPATDYNNTRRMRIACWIAKATDTHSEYLIHCHFSWQQWSCERASKLRRYVHCLSFHFRNAHTNWKIGRSSIKVGPLINWLICIRVRNLTVPMHLGLNWQALCAPCSKVPCYFDKVTDGPQT